MSFIQRHPIVAAFVALVAFTFLGAKFFPKMGAVDFVEYWSANRLFWSGQNPYDSSLMLELQNGVRDHRDEALMMWNPPWLVPLMSPITSLPYQWALSGWMAFNALALFFSARMLMKTYGVSAAARFPVWLVTICFFPAIDAISFGQVGVLFLVSICSFLLLYEKGQYFYSGMCLVPLTAKPHLFLTLFAFLGLKSLLGKEFKTLAGGVVAFAVLLAVTFVSSPRAIGYWVSSFSGSQEEATQPILWRTATLTNQLRDILFRHELPLINSENIVWLMPLAGIIAITVFFFWDRARRRNVQIKSELPLVLTLSMFFAPFAWTFDHAVLLLVPIAIIASINRDGVSAALRKTVYVLLFVALGSLFFFKPFADGQSSYFWISSLMLALYLFTRLLLRGSESARDSSRH